MAKPCCASATATARPMPREAPVTSTRLTATAEPRLARDPGQHVEPAFGERGAARRVEHGAVEREQLALAGRVACGHLEALRRHERGAVECDPARADEQRRLGCAAARALTQAPVGGRTLR